MPIINPIYGDLTLTNYPFKIDDRPGAVEIQDRDGIIINEPNDHFAININYDERTAGTSMQDYTVLASDVNALQESVIAIQRALGPGINGLDGSSRLTERLEDLESFITLIDSQGRGYQDLDNRYMWGGEFPPGLTPGTLISVKYHQHSGEIGGAEKINVATDITGLLAKQNMRLGVSASGDNSGMLTAGDIYLTTAANKTILKALDEKMDKAGGSFTGDVTVLGRFKSRIMAELEAVDTAHFTGRDVIDPEADCGVARSALSTDGSGDLVRAMVNLRYGKYVAIVRCKVASKSSSIPVASFKIRDTSATGSPLILNRNIQPNFFHTEGYEHLYIEFEHKRIDGTSKAPLEFFIEFNTGVTQLRIDSIVITPLTTALYDHSLL